MFESFLKKNQRACSRCERMFLPTSSHNNTCPKCACKPYSWGEKRKRLDYQRMYDLRAQGASYGDIARELGCTSGYANWIVRRYITKLGI